MKKKPIANQAYNNFIALLVRLYPQRLGDILHQYFAFSSGMNFSEKLQKIDRLKVWLDSFRPLSPTLVAELKKLYDVRFTYYSNAIRGNTLTQRETELVLQTSITVGSKTLREHLAVIGHRDAIDYIETLTRSDSAIGEWELKQIHNLILTYLLFLKERGFLNVSLIDACACKSYPISTFV